MSEEMDEYTKAHFNKIKEEEGNCYEAKVACNQNCPLWDKCVNVFYHSKCDILNMIKEYEDKNREGE